MSMVGHAHDIKALDHSVSALEGQLKQLARTDELEELRLKVFPRPGWTTPAEYALVSGAIAALRTQVDGALALKRVIVDASRQIGR